MIIDLRRAMQEAEAKFKRHCDLLTITQYAILDSCDLVEPQSQTQLVERCGVDRSTLANVVGRLVERKWVIRVRTKEDARAYDVKLSKAGQKVLDKAAAGYALALAEVAENVPEKQRKNFVSWLNRIAERPVPAMAEAD